LAAFFAGNGKSGQQKPAQPARNGSEPSRPARKVESVEVTSPRLYVGNLSFDATESDLFDLFNGVGHVQNAEVVSYRHNQRSKGFAFVSMQTIDEAKRAVEELHDKEFLGRKLVVSGAKSSEHHVHE
jgi:RNA recognition motif-containing protein